MKNLLWTGGWDSSYRLLELTVLKRALVQPYYVVDRARPASSTELRTQDIIREALKKLDSEAGALVLPTKVIQRNDIPADPEITEQFRRLRGRAYIGNQYDFLFRMAKSLGLIDLELSVHKDDKLFDHLEGHVEEVDGVWRLSPNAPVDLQSLRKFSFPVLMLTKLEMKRKAVDAGFQHLMELTWFCHYPVRGQPCGGCPPCRYTIEEGLAERVPRRMRARAAVLKPIKEALSLLKTIRR
jgi:hypothetical protein